MGRRSLALAALPVVVACDLGDAATLPRQGPPLTLVASSPANGDGLACTPSSPTNCGVPVDAPIELRFDRFVHPNTAVRQSIVVTTGGSGVFLRPAYDPTERVLVFHLPDGGAWLPGVRYTVDLVRPSESPDGWGLRAFDGAELAEDGPAPRRFTFRVRRDPTPTRVPVGPAPTFAEVLGIMERSGCAAGGCHGTATEDACPTGTATGADACPTPRMGLNLGDAGGFAATAISQVAHQTEIAPNSADPQVDGDRFGVAMPIVAPANAGNSYLVYKLLVNGNYRPGEGPCPTRYAVDLPDDCSATTAAELERLRAAFVFGSPMPLGPEGPGERLSVGELRVIVDWIATGAPLD